MKSQLSLHSVKVNRPQVLAHQIRKSENLQWDKKSFFDPCYLTQAIMRELFIDCNGTYPHYRQVTLLLCVVYCFISTNYSCANVIEKSIPDNQCLSLLFKPCDANRWSSGRIFLSHHHIQDKYLYHVSFLSHLTPNMLMQQFQHGP